MLFKAKTDDIFEADAERKPDGPICRLFGVAGAFSPELCIYAGRHGVAVVERHLRPSPVLADRLLCRPNQRGPSSDDLGRLRYLYRPRHRISRRAPNSSLTLAPPLATVTTEALLAAQTKSSKRLAILGWQRENV